MVHISNCKFSLTGLPSLQYILIICTHTCITFEYSDKNCWKRTGDFYDSILDTGTITGSITMQSTVQVYI